VTAANPFDDPLLQSVTRQRDLAMNNWAVMAARVLELEAENAALRRRIAPVDLAAQFVGADDQPYGNGHTAGNGADQQPGNEQNHRSLPA